MRLQTTNMGKWMKHACRELRGGNTKDFILKENIENRGRGTEEQSRKLSFLKLSTELWKCGDSTNNIIGNGKNFLSSRPTGEGTEEILNYRGIALLSTFYRHVLQC